MVRAGERDTNSGRFQTAKNEARVVERIVAGLRAKLVHGQLALVRGHASIDSGERVIGALERCFENVQEPDELAEDDGLYS